MQLLGEGFVVQMREVEPVVADQKSKRLLGRLQRQN
jgi:hypothetical protein